MQPRRNPWLSIFGMFVVLVALTAAGCWYASTNTPAPVITADPPAVDPAEAIKPFGTWPRDVKPDLTFVLTGQTYGYLSPCGCSRPQRGGLERRANLITSLKAKGWPVVGLDLGDIAPPKGLPKQNLLKYKASMESLA
ncbi:MAG: hypothetical protein ACRC8S_17030, partial [Fimbriiglobus sp.]